MRQWTVDAFASEPFIGNPACVVEPFAQWPLDDWMQALAQENNQAETAFLRRAGDADRFDLRWFTPRKEAPLCGHATLAAAHVLFAELDLAAPSLTFATAAGPLTVARDGETLVMDFPADPPRRIATPPGLADALGVEPVEVWAAAYLVAVLADEATVRTLRPDIVAIEALSSAGWEQGSVVVTAPGDAGGFDGVSRFFAPGFGIPEDPVTGSAHCILAPLYASRLMRADARFFQAFPGRGGELATEVRGDRVLLRGQAVTVIESRLRLAA